MSAGRAFEPKVSKGHAVVAAHASQGADRVAVAELSGDGSATHDSLLGYILEAAERLAFAWTVLCKDASRHGDALAARRDSARRVIDRLQNLVSLARDTLAPSTVSPQTISAAENSTDSSSRPRTDAAKDERAPSASAGSLDRGDTTPDAPSLVAYCLGAFQVLADDTPIDVWPTARVRRCSSICCSIVRRRSQRKC